VIDSHDVCLRLKIAGGKSFKLSEKAIMLKLWFLNKSGLKIMSSILKIKDESRNKSVPNFLRSHFVIKNIKWRVLQLIGCKFHRIKSFGKNQNGGYLVIFFFKNSSLQNSKAKFILFNVFLEMLPS
jgi:hypothetical protein